MSAVIASLSNLVGGFDALVVPPAIMLAMYATGRWEYRDAQETAMQYGIMLAATAGAKLVAPRLQAMW